FSTGLAWVRGETTVLHPFRDVNPQVFAHARTVAIARDEAGIDALLRPALHTVAEIERTTNCARRRATPKHRSLHPRPPRTCAQFDGELRRALERRCGCQDPFLSLDPPMSC